MILGFHVSKSHSKKTRTMSDALKQDVAVLAKYGFARCAQIFVTGPRDMHENLSAEDKITIRKFTSSGATLVIHGSYIDNPWGLSAASIHNIKQELITCSQIGATGVIIHLAAKAATDALGQVLEKITSVELPGPVPILWLEIHTAKASSATYETPQKIQQLFARVAKCNTHGMRIGLCIDTAHLFACGTSFRDYNPTYAWLEAVATAIAGHPIMIHLNDSATTLGSGRDQHAMLTRGNIWGDFREDGHQSIADSGLMAVLDWADENKIVTILERNPDHVEHDLKLIAGLGYSPNEN